jgi:hypothetical protein
MQIKRIPHYLAGVNSWKELVRIIKAHILRSKSTELQGDDIFRSIVSRQHGQEQKRILDKLKLKKAVLFIAVMFFSAISISLMFVVSKISGPVFFSTSTDRIPAEHRGC